MVKNAKHHLMHQYNHEDILLLIDTLAFLQKRNWSNRVLCLLLRENQFALLPCQYIGQYRIERFVFAVRPDKNKLMLQEQNLLVLVSEDI